MQRREYDLITIGKNLKRLRLKNHFSVEEVRDYLCLGSVQAVYKYERGKGYPQVDTMFALMELYGATLKDIVGETHEEGSSPSSPHLRGLFYIALFAVCIYRNL